MENFIKKLQNIYRISYLLDFLNATYYGKPCKDIKGKAQKGTEGNHNMFCVAI